MSALLAAELDNLSTAVDAAAGLDETAIGAAGLIEGLELMVGLEARLRAVQSRWLRRAETTDATVDEAGRSTRWFLIEDCRLGPREASKRVKLARGLLFATQVESALAAGEITVEHAQLIVDLLTKIPTDVKTVAETELVKLALDHPPYLLLRAARAIRERLGLDDDADERAARREADRSVTIDETFDGYGSLTGTLTPEIADALRRAVDAAAPPAGDEDQRTSWQRRHDGLGELANFYLRHADTIPADTGERPRVIVTIDYDKLRDQLSSAVGQLDNGIELPATTIRRLACDAELIPAVLNSRGDVLDIATTTRTITTAVRRAAKIRDRNRCAFPRCTRHITDCHHITWWSHGGQSTLDNVAWLCPFHHWLIHQRGWTMQRNPNLSYTWTNPHGRTITSDPPQRQRAP